MSDENDAKVRAAVPAFVAMLKVAADEEAPTDELDRRALLLADKHELTKDECADAFIIASFKFAESLGPKGVKILSNGFRDTFVADLMKETTHD